MELRGSGGDPRGIQGGSESKTGDPGFVVHMKNGGSDETNYPLYNIKSTDTAPDTHFWNFTEDRLKFSCFS